MPLQCDQFAVGEFRQVTRRNATEGVPYSARIGRRLSVAIHNLDNPSPCLVAFILGMVVVAFLAAAPASGVGAKRTLTLCRTRSVASSGSLSVLKLPKRYSIVMFLPKEKILFAVDFNSLGAVPSRLAVNDSYPTEWEASLKKTLALGWERMIPGHPGPNGRLGTRKDMEEQIAFMTDLASEVKKASDAGKCFDPATKEVRVPKYQTLTNYEQNIEWNVHRWCGYYGRGI